MYHIVCFINMQFHQVAYLPVINNLYENSLVGSLSLNDSHCYTENSKLKQWYKIQSCEKKCIALNHYQNEGKLCSH